MNDWRFTHDRGITNTAPTWQLTYSRINIAVLFMQHSKEQQPELEKWLFVGISTLRLCGYCLSGNLIVVGVVQCHAPLMACLCRPCSVSYLNMVAWATTHVMFRKDKRAAVYIRIQKVKQFQGVFL